MNVVTGLELGLLIMVLGAAGLTAFAMYLTSREPPRRTPDAPIALTRDDARRLITLIDNLQPIKEKLGALVADPAPSNGDREMHS